MKLKLALGLNRVRPIHELLVTEDGYCECSKLLNYLCTEKSIKKVKGTEAYNSSVLPSDVPWLLRSYHKRADGSFQKALHAYSNGDIYYGDDVAGTWTATNVTTLNANAIPLHALFQVSGNSILYLYNGVDGVYKYDGNGSFQWETTTINDDLGRIVESGTVHLDRMWYVSVNSSIITYSANLEPETLTGTDVADIIVGQEKDSIVRRIVVGANETMYIFKNQSIYELYGRTPSTFQIRLVTDKYGLASKRAIYPVGNGFIFLNEFNKELYFFGGTESSIVALTEKTIKLRDILDDTQVEKTTMTVHNGYFRFAFKHKNDSIHQDRELVYPIHFPRPDGLPRWSMTKGLKILSYALMQRQGDDNILLTGRDDTGKVMYMNRGKRS
jgi:hypothetical protein